MKKLPLLIFCIICSIGSSGQSLKDYITIGSTGDDGIYDMAVDQSGNRYVAGWYTGSVDLDPGVGSSLTTAFGDRDIFFCKYDSAWNFLWGFGLGSSQQDEASHLCVDATGNVIIAGRFSGNIDFNPGPGVSTLTSAGTRDIFLVKYDTGGNYTWGYSMGGSNYDDAEDVTTDLSNNIYLAGSFQSTATFNGLGSSQSVTSIGGDDGYIAKFAGNGALIWVHSIGSTSGDEVATIMVDNSNHLYCAGYIAGQADFDLGPGVYNRFSNGAQDAFMARYSIDGDLNWVNCIGGAGYDLVMDFDILDDKIFATGGFHNTVDFDPGVPSLSKVSAGLFDVFIWEMDTTGVVITALGSGSTGDDIGRGLEKDNQGGFILSGIFEGSVQMHGMINSLTITSAGGSDVGVSRYDDTGDISWAFGIGGTSNEDSRTVVSGGNTSLYVSGFFNGSADLTADEPNPLIVNSNGSTDAFVAQYDIPAISTTVQEVQNDDVLIYPVPVNNIVTIRSEKILDKISLWSSDGKLLKEFKAGTKEFEISMLEYPQGYYLLQLHSDSGNDIRKILIQ